jgi:aryl-alcohol dehydrogenase-like predicted oxidoreductase
MKMIQLGDTKEHISQLALGCMLMGTSSPEGESRQILDRYLDAGGNFLDTANCYAWFLRQGSAGGESEALLGRWLSETGKRDRVFLATKGAAMVRRPEAHWTPTGELDWANARRDFEGAGAETLRRSLEASLRRLQTDHVDLYYVHVDDWVTPLEETLEALLGFVRAGKVRYLGWSNVRTARLAEIRRICLERGWPSPVALQQQHTYLRPRAGLDQVSIVDAEQMAFLEAHPELTLIAYSPILKGVYDDAAKRDGHWAMQPYVGADTDARLAALAALAHELGVRPNQLVLAWLLAQPAPQLFPLVGPRTLAQLDEHLEALRLELPTAAVSQLDAAGFMPHAAAS